MLEYRSAANELNVEREQNRRMRRLRRAELFSPPPLFNWRQDRYAGLKWAVIIGVLAALVLAFRLAVGPSEHASFEDNVRNFGR